MDKRRYFLVLALVVTPVIFSWTLEVAFVSHEMQRMIFFIWAIPGVLAYHSTMYILFLSCWIAGFVLLHDSIQ
ncbi:hypothetical protein OSG_eHP5_00105 [environmental Halophage eHP-5]|nr:hypothetical protein OSG_eHP5_00105 [environmental Halophage eHP-5]